MSKKRKTPGAGAAGGLGYACLMFLHAVLKPGIDIVLDEIQIAQAIKTADAVITGEGRFECADADGEDTDRCSADREVIFRSCICICRVLRCRCTSVYRQWCICRVLCGKRCQHGGRKAACNGEKTCVCEFESMCKVAFFAQKIINKSYTLSTVQAGMPVEWVIDAPEGSQFAIDQIGESGGGCNPIPISSSDYTQTDDEIQIPYTYLSNYESAFSNWK